MSSAAFTFTPAERVALETVAEERPEVVAALRERLAPVLDDLARTCQGRVVIEADADAFFFQLRVEFVARMMIEMAPWGEDEDLREPVVDLLARHLLAGIRDEFVQCVLETKRN